MRMAARAISVPFVSCPNKQAFGKRLQNHSGGGSGVMLPVVLRVIKYLFSLSKRISVHWKNEVQNHSMISTLILNQ